MTAVQCVGPSLIDPAGNSVSFAVDFNEVVTGVAPADFAVDGLGGTVTSVSGSGSSYTVEVGGIPQGNGTVGLDVLTGGGILDWFGTPLAGLAEAAIDQQFTISTQLYWDASGGNGPAGGSGTWSADDANWHVGGPDGPLQGWADGSDAFFAGAPGTVQLTGPAAVTSITVLSSGYVFQGGGIVLTPSLSALPPDGTDGETLSSSAPALDGGETTIDVAAGSAAIDAPVSGDLMKTGDGALVLGDGIQSCSSLTVTAGVLDLGGAVATVPQAALTVDAGILDLGGTTAAAATATLTGGSIVDGTLDVGTALDLYNGTVSADITGPAVLDKLGPGSVVLVGDNTYAGGTSALDGTLIAAAGSLPGPASGPGTVIVQPTLYWSGSGDWTTGQWQLADGTPSPWLDGSSIVIAAGSNITLSGAVNVTAVTFEGGATITGNGTLSLPSSGTTIAVVSSTATIAATLAGGGLAESGAGTLVLDGTLDLSDTAIVDQGCLDVLSPLASPPVAAGGQVMGPGAVQRERVAVRNRPGHVRSRAGPVRRRVHRPGGHAPDLPKRGGRRPSQRRHLCRPGDLDHLARRGGA